jgi:hypothetical protein
MDVPTLGEIKTAVRGLLQDDQFDDNLLTQAANWFQYEVFNETRSRLMETSDTVEAEAGDTSIDLPSDLMTRIAIYVTAPQVYELSDAMSYRQFMANYANFATAPATPLRAWTDYGNAIRPSAPLQTAVTLQIDYLREPTPMEKDGDDCEIPRRYMEMIAYGTLARAMEINEDREEAADVRDLLAPMLTTFKRNEGRGGGKVGPAAVIGTGRNRRSYRADRDF